MCTFIYIQREGGRERNRKHSIGEERGLWERKPQHSLYIPYTLSLSITDQENLAKNILRCFHTKEFWNTSSHLKSHTSSIPCMAKICTITSKNETLRQNVCFKTTLNNSANSKAKGFATMLVALTAGRKQSNVSCREAWDANADPRRKKNQNEGKDPDRSRKQTPSQKEGIHSSHQDHTK